MKYGRYTIVGDAPSRSGMRCVACRCDCGTERIVFLKNLKSGNSTSCGCASSEATAARNFKHGKAKTATWRVWAAMLQRCSPAAGKNKADYFDRGIRVCDSWSESFEAFLSDMGERPAGLSLDRWPDKDGDYEPGKCRWATAVQQARNTRRNRLLTFDGETLTAVEWAQRNGWRPHVITNRVRYGWTDERILTTPANPAVGMKEGIERMDTVGAQ